MGIVSQLEKVTKAQIVIFIGILMALFLYINSSGTTYLRTVSLYVLIGLVGIVSFRYLISKKITGVELLDKSDWKIDIVIGVVIGITFIILNQISPAITIGFPGELLDASGTNKALTVGGIAPILEEALFRGLFLGLLISFGIGFFLSASIQAVGFTLFHITAYGLLSYSSGAYFGAMIFGLGMAYLVQWRKSILPAIIVHSIFNLYLVSKALVILNI